MSALEADRTQLQQRLDALEKTLAPPRAEPRPDVDESQSPTPRGLPLAWNVAAGRPVIARSGGVTYADWGNANDAVDYATTTRAHSGGRWGNDTNSGEGTFQVVDLESVQELSGVGYSLDWDGAFKNPLTFRVEVSTDNQTWTRVSEVVHQYSPDAGSNKVDVDIAIP
ncbi:MAG TPA: discoidin domain-containing protein, partial [Archangium sp.]|nr:discoidin domain-containing protein [Archangium sp.]